MSADRATTKAPGWLRRSSWKLGSILAHVAKRLAKPATIPISAVVLSKLSAVSPEQPIEDVAALFVGGRTTQMPVVDHGVALGVVTRDAVAGTIETDGPHTPVGLVELRDVVVVDPGAPVDDVLERLDASPGAVALVFDRGAPVGMVTREELDAYLAEAA